MSDQSLTNRLLLDINEQLGTIQREIGGINEQLKFGSQKHREFQEQLDMIDRRTDIIEDKTVRIENILTPNNEPSLIERVKKLEIFHGKVGAVVIAGGTLIGTVLSFLWAGITWIVSHWNEIRGFFTRG